MFLQPASGSENNHEFIAGIGFRTHIGIGIFIRVSGIERQGGEQKHGSGEQTHTPTVATYTHAYTPPDTLMDCIRSLKAADTNEPVQERIKHKAEKRP